MRIAILAGESSGDLLGASLMAQIPNVDFAGIGGEAMAACGLNSIFPMNELSLMGVAEVLPKARGLYRRINEMADFVRRGNFDALITIDSPDFSFRVARRVKKTHPDLPIIHYVAPSVWAWRAGRAKKMAKVVDHVLCLLPFEPQYMLDAGMSADFVGHPVAIRPRPDQQGLSEWRKSYGQVIGLFPGSRNSEMKYHLQEYAQMWKTMSKQVPHNMVIPVYDHVREQVEQAFSGLDRFEIISPTDLGFEEFQHQKSLLMHGAELAIATSGTVSFELSWADTPAIVGYQTGKITQFFFKRMAKVKWASLTNILCDREIIPELLFNDFTPDNLADAALSAIENPIFAQIQRDGFKDMRAKMIPELSAGQSVMQFLTS